jgi:Flp pilus assembly pilin Flp
MMKNHFLNTLKDKSGASLVEFSLLLVLLMLLTFSIVDGGYLMYQFNSAQKATQVGARYAATRAPVVIMTSDCMVGSGTATAGTDCLDIAGNDTWSETCKLGSSGTTCDNDARLAILNEMQRIYPNIKDENLEVTFSGTGLGYVGRGKPVPAITVTLRGLQYNYVAVGQILNFDSVLNINTTQSTIIGEDLGEGS